MVGGVGGITPLDIPPTLAFPTRGNARNEESPAAASRLPTWLQSSVHFSP